MNAVIALMCPECEGRVELEQGTRVVACPYCGTVSVLRGEHGVHRYQVPLRCTREEALRRVHELLSNVNGRFGQSLKAVVSAMTLVHLPQWRVSAVGMVWGYGKDFKGLFDYSTEEFGIIEQVTWEIAGSDASEFGLDKIHVGECPLEGFDSEVAHMRGMVFEPIIDRSEAVRRAEESYEPWARSQVGLDSISSLRTGLARWRVSLVYYPLWVARLAFQGQAYQIIVDGLSGDVRSASVPGSPPLYRAGALVFGTALGVTFLEAAILLVVHIAKALPWVWLLPFIFLVGLDLVLVGYREYLFGSEVLYGDRAQRLSGTSIGIIDTIRRFIDRRYGWRN